MCNICIDDTRTIFVFPQDGEDLGDWLERLGEHDHLALAMMYHTDDGLEEIAKSYRLQGFTHQDHRAHVHRGSRLRTILGNKPYFNVLYLRDLVFITYGEMFQQDMGWSHENHV